jgi:hypothetical protein
MLTHDPSTGKFIVQFTGRNRNEPRLVTYSALFLIIINVLTTLGGLGLLGASAYAFISFKTLFAGLLSENGIIGGMVAGLLIALFSILGIFGTTNQHFRSLAFYTFIQGSLLIVILSILGVFVQYIATVEQVAQGNIVVWSQNQIDVNDFFLSAYVKCCKKNDKFCAGNAPGQDLYCENVDFCNQRNSTTTLGSNNGCFVGDYGSTPKDPPKTVYDEFCATLFAGGVVGPAVGSTCGGGKPQPFIVQLFDFVKTNVLWCYYAVGFLSGLLFFEVLACIYLLRFLWLVENGQYEAPSPSTRSNMPIVAAEPENDEERFEFSHDEVRERYQSSARKMDE